MIIKEFLPIKDFDGYFVNSQGIIISNNDGTILKQIRPQIHNSGYHSIKLTRNDGVRKHIFVHRIVASHFLDNPNNLSDVNHIDLNKFNNDVSNLEWCSHSDNLKHFYRLCNKTSNTRCKLFVCGVFVDEFDSIRKACQYINDNYEPCNINSVSNQLRVGISAYKGKYSIERL